MAFLISNIKIPEARHLGQLWYKGDFIYTENSAKILEGHLLKPKKINIKNLFDALLKRDFDYE